MKKLSDKTKRELIPQGRWAVAELLRKDVLPDKTLTDALDVKYEFTKRGLERIWNAIWQGPK